MEKVCQMEERVSQWEKGAVMERVSDGGESELVGEGGCDGECVECRRE